MKLKRQPCLCLVQFSLMHSCCRLRSASEIQTLNSKILDWRFPREHLENAEIHQMYFPLNPILFLFPRSTVKIHLIQIPTTTFDDPWLLLPPPSHLYYLSCQIRNFQPLLFPEKNIILANRRHDHHDVSFVLNQDS